MNSNAATHWEPCAGCTSPFGCGVPMSCRKNAAHIQVACDRCTQGVMDTLNDHWRGLCPCECHTRQPGLAWTPTAVLEARVEEWVRNG